MHALRIENGGTIVRSQTWPISIERSAARGTERLRPDDRDILEALASFHHEGGDDAKAAAYAERARKLEE